MADKKPKNWYPGGQDDIADTVGKAWDALTGGNKPAPSPSPSKEEQEIAYQKKQKLKNE